MTEKRNFFRVNRDVLFDYHSVDTYTADNEAPEDQFDSELPVQLFATLQNMDKEAREIARSMGEAQRPLLEYIDCLNRKIDLLARELVSDKVPEQQMKSRINLSHGGLAFLADKALYKGAFIALRLVFLPGYTGVILFAEITRCEAAKGDRYHIAAKFHRISETQQQVLAKAIMDTQLAIKRQNRADKAETD